MFAALCGITAGVVWYLQYDIERDTRMVANARRQRGKTGEVMAEDIDVDHNAR
jgi:hypothetical protein